MNRPDLVPHQFDSRLLRVYALYRLFLAAMFLAMAHFEIAPEYLGSTGKSLFYYTTLAYTLINLLSLPLFFQRDWLPGEKLLFGLLFVDVVALNLLMYSSGGLDGSLGYLLMVTVAASSIFQRSRIALAMAAIASIILIGVSLGQYLVEEAGEEVVVRSGVFGTLLFATALFFIFLTRRLTSAQEIAISEAKAAAHLQELNNLVLSRMHTGVLVFDKDYRIEHLNERAALLLGFVNDGNMITTGESLSSIPKLTSYYKHWKSNPRMRLPTFRPSASNIPLQISFSETGAVNDRHSILFLEDARSLSQQAQQLKNVSMGQLTGSIAHEIRNPLGAISHAAQLLNESRLDEADQKLVDVVLRHSSRVDNLVRNILQLSQQKGPEINVINIYDACLNAVTQIEEGKQFRNPVVEIDYSGRKVEAPFDPSQLQQVLINLLSNALRHSEAYSGAPWARIEFLLQEGIKLPVLKLLDKGPGIPEETAEKIFEPFFTTEKQGTGLGLYIARELCEINFAALSYVHGEDSHGYFQIVFSDPAKQIPDIQQNG